MASPVPKTSTVESVENSTQILRVVVWDCSMSQSHQEHGDCSSEENTIASGGFDWSLE